jgi:DNA ligase D-like protein (predicted 3'-phosphoesterase)
VRFVVQQHHATARHYDLRLEAEDGTLKSWAVPRGPSLDPAVKRLAVRVGDHELGHADFEGRLEGGQPVIIWDEGTFENTTRDGRSVVDAVEDGHLSFWVEATKLQGGFALTRTDVGGREQWLLVKKRDRFAAAESDVVVDAPWSVRSGLRIDEVAG